MPLLKKKKKQSKRNLVTPKVTHTHTHTHTRLPERRRAFSIELRRRVRLGENLSQEKR